MIYHVAQIKLRYFTAWWFMFQQMISTWRFFLGKQKERCEVYVGWLAAIGVLAHFGAGQIQLKIFTSMLYFIFGAQPNFGFLAKFHRNLLHNIGHRYQHT